MLKIEYIIMPVEHMLATTSNNLGIFTAFQGVNAPTPARLAEEQAFLKHTLEGQGVDPDQPPPPQQSIFMKENGHPYIMDYCMRGFFKEQFGLLKGIEELGLTTQLKAHKKFVDGFLCVTPRQLFLMRDGKKIHQDDLTLLKRSLRVETAQGPRTCLAESECASPGIYMKFTVWLGVASKKNLVDRALDYGIVKGTGQWRNGGYGRFRWKEVSCEEVPFGVAMRELVRLGYDGFTEALARAT